MTNRAVVKFIAVFFCLVGLQTLTYFTLANKLLKKDTPSESLLGITHQADSLYVRDFYLSDCYTGDNNTYLSQNLMQDSDVVRQKFKVHHVFFQIKEKFEWENSTEKQYPLVYMNWVTRPYFLRLNSMFSVRQTEILIVAHRQVYQKDETYRWCFFFWIKTFEAIQSNEVD